MAVAGFCRIDERPSQAWHRGERAAHNIHQRREKGQHRVDDLGPRRRRHAIDMRLDPSLKSADLEFTAKLAQIAFSPRPLWMMMSVLRSRRRKPSTSKAAVKLRAGRSTSLLRV